MSEEIMAAGAGKPARTLDMVTAEIKFLDAQAGRLVMGHALEIGKRLTEAKELVPYGGWGDYLEKELNYSQSTANKLMKVFQEFGASQMGLFGPEVESESFTNLTYSKALALLSVPREEREAFAQAVDAEHLSTRELQQAIRERDEARKRAEAAEAEAKWAKAFERDLLNTIGDANDRVDKLAKELVELKARPVEVAVQEPDPAEVEKRAAELAAKAQKAQAEAEQAAAAARAEAEQKIKKANEKARAEREKLEAQLKEAEAKLAAAGEADKAEAEKLRAEAETLRKQLAMSSQEITVFKLRYSAWQEAHRLMGEAFIAIPDEETREKMRAAIRAQIKAWGWGE